jgi:integrase
VGTVFPRIRMDLSRMGLGVVQLATKTKVKREHERRVMLFEELVADSQIGVIAQLVAGDLSWEELVDARRRGDMTGAKVLDRVKAHRTLAEAVTATLPLMGKAKATRARYALSLRQLQAQTVTPWPHTPMRVKDLAALDWKALSAGWPNSAGDWNNLVRAVGRFLTLYLGHRHNAFRLDVMAELAMQETEERVPDLSLEVFESIIRATPEHVRPAYYTLLITGMRVRSEYLRCTVDDLMPATLQIRIRGAGKALKTKGSRNTVAVDPEMWPYIVAGIPSPLRYKALRKVWNAACVAVGAAKYVETGKGLRYQGLVMHDLRHALAQWTSDAGMPANKLQDMLRHASPTMTAKYARQTATRAVATSISNLIQRKA